MLRSMIACLSLLLLVGAFPASADDIDGDIPGGQRRRGSATPAPAPTPAPKPMAAAETWKRHHVSLLLSSISDSDFDTTAFNGGGEYEFRFHKYFGIGVQVEGASDDFRTVATLVPIFIHPWKGLRFTFAGGAVVDDDNDHDALLRLGVGYRFNITESITFGPEYNADLEGGTDASHLFGVRLGYQF
jgi:hypothetical protein